MLRISHNEKTYEVDESRLSIVESRLLKKFTRQAPADWLNGLKKLDGDSLAGLLFLAKFRNGEQPRWKDFDNLDVYELAQTVENLDTDDEPADPADAYLDDGDPDADDGDEEDPTG